jgi:DNA-binding SARP family transcriptional activator
VRDVRSALRPIDRGATPRVRLHLLSAFEVVRDDHAVPLAPGSQRLVAFLALQERPVRREFTAGMLWPDVSDGRAAANLRSTLWRVQKQLGVRGLIATKGERLLIDPQTPIDLRDAERAARAVLDDGECDARLFSHDVLPDWYDDWVLLERESFRQLRLSALEALCERHTNAGRLGQALEAGLLSVASEPLRESAHRALIRVHLAAGNAVEAIRQYGVCRRLLHDQLGIEPTQQLRELIDALGT